VLLELNKIVPLAPEGQYANRTNTTNTWRAPEVRY